MKTKSLILIAVVALFALSSCTQVEQGEIALKVYQLGSKKGQIEVLGPGRYANHWFGYFSYKIYPTNLQQWSWTAAATEDSPAGEQVSFQAEGQDLSADIGIEYEFMFEDEQKMIDMYRYFKRKPDDIVKDFMRKDVRSFFNKVVQTMPVEMVYSTAKDSIRAMVQSMMAEKYAQNGIRIKEITYLSSIRLPEKVRDAISAKIEAKQKAVQRENEIAEKEAEAKKKAAEAQGESDRLRIEAEGRAKAIEVEGRALAQNPQILRLKELEMQMQLAQSAKGWQTVVMSSGQAGQLLNIGGGK